MTRNPITLAASSSRALNHGIVVVGDGASDLFVEEIPFHAPSGGAYLSPNWQREPGHYLHRLNGGVLLLADMIAEAVARPASNTRLCDGNGLLQSFALLTRGREQAARDEEDDEAGWGISRFFGFQRPEQDPSSVPPIHIPAGREGAEVLVIDNAGNGYRHREDEWRQVIERDEAFELVVLKMHRPLPAYGRLESGLWERFKSMRATCKIVVVNASDLRNAGVNISYRMSWDRTVADIERERPHDTLKELLANCQLIIRLGLEGAVLIDSESIRIVCEPGSIEDDAVARATRQVPGLTSAFVAALVADLVMGSDGGPPLHLERAIRSGLAASRKLFASGYLMREVPAGPRRLELPLQQVFLHGDGEGGQLFDDKRRRMTFHPAKARPDQGIPMLRSKGWEVDVDDDELSRNILRKGTRSLMGIPHASLGKLLIADREEVENYRSVANLISTYAADRRRDKPMSIAVFGSPGSGKSFGIKTIATALNDSGRSSEPIVFEEFNVAQWQDSRDLIGALHVARDRRVSGYLPLIFFDEFDSSQGATELAWLKAFLAPMQDGAFKDGDHNHMVDRAIFIFAGGTATRMTDFVEHKADSPDALKFRKAKGPDFVSRLSGFVDVSSVDKPEKDGSLGYKLRRAIVMRDLFQRKYAHHIDREGVLQIDDDVLAGFLDVPSYRHGVRSIEAILRMSTLGAATMRIAQSVLPSDAQIELHTYARGFKEAMGDGSRPRGAASTQGSEP